MYLDGDKVKLGDQVWHDRYKWGHVIRINDGVCDVLFNEADRALTFVNDGYSGEHKVLYWQPPILFIPKKGVDYSGLPEIVDALIKFKWGGK